MNCCTSYQELPAEIKEKLMDANLFYTEVYEKNTRMRGQEMYYVWSEDMILAARVKKQFFLKAAVLESEPYVWEQGKDIKIFLNKAMEVLKKYGVQWTVCATTARFSDYPSGSRTAPCGNHIIDLTLTEEELWKNVHSKHRNSIRRGEKSGLELKVGGKELLEEYVLIANETYERSGIPGSDISYYYGLINELEDNAVIFLNYKEGEVQAGGMFYYNQAMAYYLHGASVRRPEPGAANYLLWKAVMYFKEKEVQRFSFVGYHFEPEPGSKLEGIQRFKERFGGTLEKSYNFRYEQSSAAYRMYCLAMQLKSRKPFERYKDAIDRQADKYPELNGGNEGEDCSSVNDVQ
ncbi:MAG: peptidoglycan bridge formation glycyltransferase FemA/FemB family protein [Lachnospiraceae bacterium]|nr:peptidoglycan bridge formation glycyltransferase FemA/FemB family protein [Lachnospiraceae bacterium]